MKLVSILRVKNEILIIKECLAKLSELSDEIIVLDNGSSDGTLEVYKDFSKVVQVLKTEGFNEGRDKIILLNAAKERNPDWILWIDGDEVFEKNMNRSVMDRYMNSGYSKISFRLNNFWLSRKKFRIDGKHFLYTLHPQRSMWRNTDEAYFRNQIIHNGDIDGIKGKKYISPYRLKHYGYVDKDKMREKAAQYKKVDKGKKRSYAHLDPNVKTIRLKFRECDNFMLNYFYINIVKYVYNFVWILLRIINKLKNIMSNKSAT
jgi:glycosyltransferase involved in cell wall biosynthesis